MILKGGIKMEIIAKHPYIKVIREVTGLEKTETKDKRELKLYQTKLTTRHREFNIEELVNVAVREIGEDGGLIFIHTTSGLFSYTVEIIDEKFIHIVNNLIREVKNESQNDL